MTDIQLETAPPAAVERHGGLSTADVTAGVEALRAAGVSEDAIQKALAVAEPTARDMTVPADVQRVIDGLRARGDSDQAIAATLDRHGLKPPEGDPRTETEIKFDALFPPPSPADYKFNLARHAEGIDDLPAFNMDARAALVAMRMEPATGDWLVETALDQAKWWGQADQPARDLYKIEQAEELKTKFGEDGVKLYVELAAQAVARASPDFATFLAKSGASQSAAVIRFLALNEARLTRRSTG